MAIPDQPTTRESLGCLTALFVVTFLPLIGYVVFTQWSDGHMDGGVIVFAGVIALAGIVLMVRRAPVRMEILSDQNRWTTTVAGTQSIWPSSRSISLSDIHRIEVERQNWSKAGDTEKHSGEPRAVFSMSLFDSDGERLSDWWMDINGIGDSRQILGFLLRVAKATGLACYRVIRSDSRQLEAVAYRKPNPDLEPVVSMTPRTNGTEAIAEAVPTVIPPFEPERIPRWLDFDALEWRPGTRVQLGKLLRFRTFLHIFLATAALAISLLDASTQGYQCMLSLVADLSAALDVPYRFEDFRDHSDYPKYDWQ